MSELAKKRCIPCEEGGDPFTEEQSREMMGQLSEEWQLVDEGRLLARSFRFKNFKETMAFVNKVAAIAEEEQHHPDMTVSYNTLTIELMTHATGGLSENDFILAAKIDEI